jgi:hypothetical protein
MGVKSRGRRVTVRRGRVRCEKESTIFSFLVEGRVGWGRVPEQDISLRNLLRFGMIIEYSTALGRQTGNEAFVDNRSALVLGLRREVCRYSSFELLHKSSYHYIMYTRL